MNDFFIKSYSLIRDNNSFLKKIKFYAVQRFLLRILANSFVPLWFIISRVFGVGGLNSLQRDKKVIVSVTTFPARINRIWIVVECMLRQNYPPDKIILWLSEDQFNGMSSLPKRLLKLQKKGLEIVFCEGDLRSHKKYYYAFEKYPTDLVITIDDDVFYSTHLIKDLVDVHFKFPEAVCCNRASKIVLEYDNVVPYKEWEYIWNEEGPSFKVFPTGCGGVLYPPKALNKDVFDKEAFMDYCKHADDIWLYFMAQLNNTLFVKTKATDELIPILNRGDSTLTSINVDDGLNDIQLKRLRNFYMENKNIDILKNLY